MHFPKIPANENQRLEILYQLNVMDTENEERFDRITRIARRLFSVPIALVSLVDSNRQWFKSAQGLEVKETPREISFCGHAILENEIMIVEDATQDVRFHDNPLVTGNPEIRFYMGCPIKIKGHNIGTLCLIDAEPRQFQPADMYAMRDLADMVQLELESVHLSTSDDLTGLSNRRGFLKIANFIFKQCQRENRSFTLLFFDLNNFKQINDNYGHAEGDKVLKNFAKSLLEHFRGSDVIARIGGDEFCVLCSGLQEANIPAILQRFKFALHTATSKNYKLGYSVGTIQYHQEQHHNLVDMLAAADAQMYDQKKKVSD
ncbi:MAG: GGDEF domain-containing protein [Legionella sp. 40-6]|nr:sensor domain-containing diguanylate cyclase [Legionella sp.]OJY34096.1 MAG: GGDEF domain-containing protein [Legionella sp. 40-6]